MTQCDEQHLSCKWKAICRNEFMCKGFSCCHGNGVKFLRVYTDRLPRQNTPGFVSVLYCLSNEVIKNGFTNAVCIISYAITCVMNFMCMSFKYYNITIISYFIPQLRLCITHTVPCNPILVY